MINRQKFYDSIRNSIFGGKLSVNQVNGTNVILDEWDRVGFADLRWLAYMLATAYHETASTMQPIEEYGKGKGRPYGKKLKMSGVAYALPNKIYFGRGLVQLTWFENYQLMGRLLNIPLLENPELALQPNVSVKIMFEGMLRGSSSFGDFTGKCLEQYFNATEEDWINARRIINGRDKASLISKYAKNFYTALD